MATCTCFSDTKQVCDHNRADEELVVEIADGDEKEILIDESTIRALMAERASTRPSDNHLASAQSRAKFYDDQYRRAREQDRQW